MSRRSKPVFWVRIIAMLCVAAVFSLGLRSAHAALEEFQHRSHGDVAASDGGWIVADCHSAIDHCAAPEDDDGITTADGHHHHNCADAPGGVVPTAMTVGVWSPALSPLLASPVQRLEDADIGRPGRVPRTSIRLT